MSTLRRTKNSLEQRRKTLWRKKKGLIRVYRCLSSLPSEKFFFSRWKVALSRLLERPKLFYLESRARNDTTTKLLQKFDVTQIEFPMKNVMWIKTLFQTRDFLCGKCPIFLFFWEGEQSTIPKGSERERAPKMQISDTFWQQKWFSVSLFSLHGVHFETPFLFWSTFYLVGSAHKNHFVPFLLFRSNDF